MRKAAQIRHRMTENRKQPWLRAALPGEALPGAANEDI